MPRQYEPYIAQDIGELWDKLGSMMLAAPRFKDTSGYFPAMNIETEFAGLDQSLNVLRPMLGYERYAKLAELSVRMRSLFEADPEDKTDDSQAGRALILEMEDILVEIDPSLKQ